MFLIVPALIGAGGSLLASGLGGLFGSQSVRDANRANLQIAREQMQFQEGQTARQMEFQERMSSTAHQRETKDLLAAGLNPMLAFAKGSSGASTPSGAAASGQTAHMQAVPNKFAGFASAANIVGTILDLKQKEANIELTRRQGVLAQGQEWLARSQGSRVQLLAQDELKRLRNENAISNLEFMRLNYLLPLVLRQANAAIEQTTASAAASRANAALGGAQLPGAEAMANFWKTDFGAATPYIRLLFGLFGRRVSP